MQPYAPNALPLVNLDYRLLLPLVGQANAALARYDGLLQGIPNPAVMLSPLTTHDGKRASFVDRRMLRSAGVHDPQRDSWLSTQRMVAGDGSR